MNIYSPCESINATANVFLGQTEAPLLVSKFLPKMTRSEIFSIMTGGFIKYYLYSA